MGYRYHLTTLLLAGACTSSTEAPRAPPVLSALAISANPLNALSAVVTFQASNADSARVLYWSSGREPVRATPFQPVPSGDGRVVILGLAPATTYSLAIEAKGAATVQSASLDVAPVALPTALQGVHLDVSVPATSPSYTLVVPEFLGSGNDGFVLVFDETGTLRWYRVFVGEGFAVEAKQLPNGDFTTYLGHSYGFQPTAGRYVQFRPSGEVVRGFAVSAPFYTDPHEMLLSFRDSTIEAVHLLGYRIQPMDLTLWNGPPNASIAVHVLERQNAAGTQEFLWNAGDQFSPADWRGGYNAQEPDLDHPSSLDMDADGNYVVSFQAVDEIDKIDAHTGRTIWRFGGTHSQFTIESDPRGGFTGQHSVRVLANGDLLFLDNHARTLPLAARAVEYSIDTTTKSARLVWQYEPALPVANPVMGSVQRLASGNTLVGFAAIGRADEVDATGRVVWQATLRDSTGAPIQFYRALRIASLYTYMRP